MRLIRRWSDRAPNPVRAAFLFTMLICAIPGMAQQPDTSPQTTPASLTGHVTTTTGANTADNLAGITVKLTGPAPASTSQTVVTDSDGRYGFKRLAAGNYDLEAIIEGFRPQVVKVTIDSGQAAVQDIAMQINSIEERVEVQGEATEVATQSATATANVTEQQLQNLPLRTDNFSEALSISLPA